jgi:hypothetical protein
MGKCRCGHGRHWHRATANAISKRRARGGHRPLRIPCQAFVRSGPTFPSGAPSGPIVKCKCRNWHPEEVTL